jgi:tetratricopeptide (TPR) repeat protein
MIKTHLSEYIYRFAPLLISIGALVLYIPFLDNPLVFDDLYFFLPGNPEHYFAQGLQLTPRWLSYFLHSSTFVLIGSEVHWQRLGNLFLLILTGYALYGFVLNILTDTLRESDPRRIRTAAVGAALLYVVHPASAFGTAYLIQRTTLLATLFSVLTWLFVWCGLRGRRGFLWCSVITFSLAALSKEHCVMTPLVSALLIILHWRTHAESRHWKIPEVMAALLLQALISVLLVAYSLHVIGTPYEPEAARLIQDAANGLLLPDGTNAYLMSVITQANLFFKYLGVWLTPTAFGVSVDMRETFIVPPVPWPAWIGLTGFLAYAAAGIWLLLRGGRLGVLGLAVLAPMAMFMTELSAIRIQEIFVIYRSVLWAPALFLAIAVGLSRLAPRNSLALAVLFSGALSFATLDRLTTFSQPLFLWDEAISLVERSERSTTRVLGTERMYHNRGLALHALDMRTNAIEDYTKAIQINPGYAHAYSDRGASLLELGQYNRALVDFDKAVSLKPDLARALAGKALALRALHRDEDARAAAREACAQGWQLGCPAE